MLSPETPFPNVGSYALLVDMDQPAPQPAELVRLFTRPCNGMVTVSFPLREGASGTKRVPAPDLIDATPLTSGESREMTDLRRELTGRVVVVGKDGQRRTRAVRGRKSKAARYEALRLRAIWSPHFERLLRLARAIESRRAA